MTTLQFNCAKVPGPPLPKFFAMSKIPSLTTTMSEYIPISASLFSSPYSSFFFPTPFCLLPPFLTFFILFSFISITQFPPASF